MGLQCRHLCSEEGDEEEVWGHTQGTSTQRIGRLESGAIQPQAKEHQQQPDTDRD